VGRPHTACGSAGVHRSLQCPQPGARSPLVGEPADHGFQELLGFARVLVLGGVGVSSQAFAILLARVFLSSPFLYSGIDKCWRWSAAQREVAASGLPGPTHLHLVTVVVQLGAGLSLLLGIEARLGALLLSLFLIPVTVMYHPFWKRSGADLVAEADHFLSNLALIGGLLAIVALGSGSISLIDHSLAQLLNYMAATLGMLR
jgi:putative oxidoreductase